jgi:hypothetical protein
MTFSYSRRTPYNVMLVEANFPLVQTAGKSLYELREDFFDLSVNLIDVHHKPIHIVSPYDISCSGGEPYANWK